MGNRRHEHPDDAWQHTDEVKMKPPKKSAARRAGILKVGLKSLVEDVRLATLSRPALHQAQLDIHYLRPALRRCASI